MTEDPTPNRSDTTEMIVDEYLARVEKRLRLREADRAAAMTEIRAHIEDKIRDEQERSPARHRADIARDVIDDFGSPQDIAVAYTPEGPVLHLPSGDHVIRLGRAVGRGTARFFKIAAIVLGVLLVTAIGLGAFAYAEFKPIIAANAPYEVFHYRESCNPCDGISLNEPFPVHSRAREVRLEVSSHATGNGSGTFSVDVIDSNGTVHYSRTYHDLDDNNASVDTTLPAVPGTWRAVISYSGYHGHAHIEVWTIGLPPDAGIWEAGW